MSNHSEKLLRLIRKENISQTEFANVIGRSKQTVSSYMSKTQLPPDVIRVILEKFDLPDDYFESDFKKDKVVSKEQYDRLESLYEHQQEIIESYKEQLDMLKEQLVEYKADRNRKTG